MNSFFDSDEISPIGTPCGHYTEHLICSRRIFKILIGATKSFGGVNIFFGSEAIGQMQKNKT